MSARPDPRTRLYRKVQAHTERVDGREVPVLVRGTPLWHLVISLGEQVLVALDDLGFVRTGPDGRPVGFRIKELAVSRDGRYVVIHLDVTSVRLYQPAAPTRAQRGRPVPYLHLVNDRVVEQVRVRVCDLLGGRVQVWADNHFYVRYVVDLEGIEGPDHFPSGNLVDYIDDASGALTIPLGLPRNGLLRWYDLHQGLHGILTGRTGGGKSTWMDGAICTLVRHTPPDRLQLAFLDGQGLNFSPYQALTEYHFTDAEGRLPVVWRQGDVVAAVVRLNREHQRRVAIIGQTPWSSIEEYNEHVAEEERLPYIAVFTDELAILRDGMTKEQMCTFDAAINSLLVGGRKVGFRVFLCTQYLKGSVIRPETAAQAALVLAFWNSPQGSKNSIGDTAAAHLPGRGRFIADGLPGGRQILQALFVDRETVLRLLDFRHRRPTFPVDSIVLDVIAFSLERLEGRLSYDGLAEAFGHLMSKRQIGRLLAALERVGLALPANPHTFPPIPRRLRVRSIEEAVGVLQFHPEICFREGEDGLVFGPPGGGKGGSGGKRGEGLS
ncbi:MAG TPA: hypothetical protein G4N97_11190 [Thermoflexia bacterium]|nr:hypothetical protein [Thermoflexia bacterium]